MDQSTLSCHISNPAEPNLPPKAFTFDGVYGTDSTTEAIYNDNGFALVEVRRYGPRRYGDMSSSLSDTKKLVLWKSDCSQRPLLSYKSYHFLYFAPFSEDDMLSFFLKMLIHTVHTP
jgi:hypothetical protein